MTSLEVMEILMHGKFPVFREGLHDFLDAEYLSSEVARFFPSGVQENFQYRCL